jgi:hypothetical protein
MAGGASKLRRAGIDNSDRRAQRCRWRRHSLLEEQPDAQRARERLAGNGRPTFGEVEWSAVMPDSGVLDTVFSVAGRAWLPVSSFALMHDSVQQADQCHAHRFLP